MPSFGSNIARPMSGLDYRIPREMDMSRSLGHDVGQCDNTRDDHERPADTVSIQKVRLMNARAFTRPDTTFVERQSLTPFDQGLSSRRLKDNPFCPVFEPEQWDDWQQGFFSKL